MRCGISEVLGRTNVIQILFTNHCHVFRQKVENVVVIARQMNEQLLKENQQLKKEKEELIRAYESEKLDIQYDGRKLVNMTRELMIEIIFLHAHTGYLYSTLSSPLYAMRAYSQRMGTAYPAL